MKDEEKDEQVSPMEAAISFIEQEIIKTTAESTQEAKRACKQAFFFHFLKIWIGYELGFSKILNYSSLPFKKTC